MKIATLILVISLQIASANPTWIKREDLPKEKAKAEEAAFKSPEIQKLLTRSETTWEILKMAVENKALADNSTLREASKDPFELLSKDEKALYQSALQKANSSPTVQKLREQIGNLQLSIDTLTDELTPGYKSVQEKLSILLKLGHAPG